MGAPIIDPRWVYWLGVVPVIKSAFLFLGVLAFMISVICLFLMQYHCHELLGETGMTGTYKWVTGLTGKMTETAFEKMKELSRQEIDAIIGVKVVFTAGLITGAIFLIAGVFLPDKETMIGMKIAEYATYENLQLTAEQLKAAIDYITESIMKIKAL